MAFGVGTLMCGLATSVWMMILGRAIAGMGGGSVVMKILKCNCLMSIGPLILSRLLSLLTSFLYANAVSGRELVI